MSTLHLFAPDAPKVWTIPPGTNFLDALARTLAEETGLADNPAALADGLIYVPNRRSARALALALHRQGGGRTILPPDIRALGDLEIDEPPTGAEDALTGLGPPLSASRRLGALAQLVTAFYARRDLPLPPASAIAAARELGRLLDSAALSGTVDWTVLPDLVEDTDLAAHWVASVEFLSIVTEAWPDWLAENGAVEPFQRRLIVAAAIAASVKAAPPSGPFIIAGSTGATPASRTLMLAATELANGRVVLPGLDRDAPETAWPIIANEPDHPQFALAGTLNTLGLAATDVPVWPGVSVAPDATARQRLVHESLAPASQTADWLKRLEEMSGADTIPEFASKALSGLSLIEAADEAEEALLAALVMRETLETPGQTAALITPDATMARQVAAILKRWDLDIAPSGGIPLIRTPQGALMTLALQWAMDTGDPVALAALLKHPAVNIDRDAGDLFEMSYLRGARRWDDISDLKARIPAFTTAANASRHTALASHAEATALALLDQFERLAAIAAPFADADHRIVASTAVETLTHLLNGLVGDETTLWSGPIGAAVSRCLEALAEIAAGLADLTPAGFAEILDTLSASTSVRAPGIEHPRLAIWGPLEARLQQADRIILAELNEGVWPARPQPDAFLPRRFRTSLGLPAPEARLGLAAHDFAQLACGSDVVMLYAARREDAPAVASRWVLRLKTLAEGALGEMAPAALAPPPLRDPRPWAEALTADQQAFPADIAKPRPNPPVAARPNQLSVTRIDTLQRDPYAIYAGNILKLKKLDQLGAPLDVRPRGTAIHAALEDFDNAPPKTRTADALHADILQKLRAIGEPDHLLAAERAALGKAAEAYVDWWQARADTVAKAWPEVRGAVTFNLDSGPFTLTGIADRVELGHDGAYTIIDFKTGDGKKRKPIDAGFEQQLPLLASMAKNGHLKDLPPARINGFGYVSVRFRFDAPKLTKGAEDAEALAAQSTETLTRLIEAYRAPDAVYLSVPRVQVKSQYDGDFDRLARRAEWAGDTSDE